MQSCCTESVPQFLHCALEEESVPPEAASLLPSSIVVSLTLDERPVELEVKGDLRM